MENLIKSDSIKNLALALCNFQVNQETIAFNSTNPFLKNKYANLTILIESSKNNLHVNGLTVSQLLTNDGVLTILAHASGEFIGSTFKIDVTEIKGLNSAQSMGVTITYARRYAYAAILGLVTDEDTDGHGDRNKTTPIHKGQKQALQQKSEKPQEDEQENKKAKRNYDLINELFNTQIINEPTKTIFENKTKTANSNVVLDAIYDSLLKKKGE